MGRIVVPLDSANPGYGTFVPLHTDHLHVCKPGAKEDYVYTATLDFINEAVAYRKRERAVERAIVAIEEGWQMNAAEVVTKKKEAEAQKKRKDPVLEPDHEREAELTELMLSCCR